MKVNRRSVLGAIGTAGVELVSAEARAGYPQSPPPGLPAPAAAPAPPARPPIGVRGRMTGALAAAETLKIEGVPCVFGVPGAQNNEFWDAMKARDVPYCLVSHESAASVMADASARVTGRVGAFVLVPGPGLTNAMTGIGEALLDTSPVVGLVTDVKRGPGAPVGQVHALSNAAIMRTVSKAVVEVHHEGQIPPAIHRAFRLARLGPPGPVGVVIPYDLFSKDWDYDEPVPPEIAPPWDEDAYRRAVGLLRDPEHRVGIYAGLGCAEASAELRAVAELLQAPVATTVSGKGVMPDDHPLAVGWGYGGFGTRSAEKAFEDVDVVLAIGARYSEVTTANYAIPRHEHVIHVDLDPSVLGKNVPACVALNADAGDFLGRLIAQGDQIRRPHNGELIGRIRHLRGEERAGHLRVEIRDGVDPMRFLAILGQTLGPEGLLFVDVTASTHWAAEAVRKNGPRRYITPADNQSMGWAVSASIGGQRVRPDLPVACVTGDGCFLMSGLEASTAARSHLPVKFFVLDDGAYHYMQMLQDSAYGRTTATELAKLHYGALARGMGLAYFEINSNDDVFGGVALALAHPGPALVRVAISYKGREMRWHETLKRNYFRGLDADQKARIVRRRLAQALDPTPEND